MAEGLQVRRRVGERLLGHPGGPRGPRRGAERLQRRGQRIRVRSQRGIVAGTFDRGLHPHRPQLQRRAAVHHDLAAQQVERLDAVRALVDHVQAVVAPVLLHRDLEIVSR